MREQDRRPIWLVPETCNDGSPRASMTTAALNTLQKQGDVSRIPAAPTAVLLQGSGTSSTATLSPMQGSSTSPTVTLACTQGSGTFLPDTLAPSYTPHCTSEPSPCIYKREVQGLHAEGRAGERANEQAHSLSRANACNPYYEHTPWCEITRAAFPPCVPSCANPSGLGHAATNLLVGPGTPRVETPTVGAPGRGLLRVNEQLPVEFQMGTLQQSLQPGTVLRFGSLEFMSLDGSYDMVLLPPQRDSNHDGRQLARRRRTRRRLPPWRKSSIPVCLATLLAAGGGDGATMARQEAAPRRLSLQSESTAPAPQRGTCRALSSRLRQRRTSLPRNMPTPSGQMTPAHS
jgi:hypothetical protein